MFTFYFIEKIKGNIAKIKIFITTTPKYF